MSLTLGETVTYYSLEGVFLCGCVPMQTVCAQCIWGEGWIRCGCKSCLSSWYAGLYHIGKGVWLVMEESESVQGVGQYFYAQWPSLSCQGWDLLLSGGSKSPQIWVQAGSASFKCVFFLLPARGNPLQHSCLENPMDWGAW